MHISAELPFFMIPASIPNILAGLDVTFDIAVLNP